MKKLYPLFLFVILLSLFSVGSVAAQDGGGTGVSDDEVNLIAHELFCPVCENTPLDVCETQACKQWRELIRLKLSEGWTEKEIKQYFVDNYGARVLAEPPAEGFYLLVYFVPPIVILAGLFILFRAFRQWKKNDKDQVDIQIAEANSTSSSDTNDEYIARLEEEMRKRD
ncbi:MAG: cytochrome c-type biogenesis protein CcmH [Anaerolineae bacterium]|jgi:cytochrome c-type biogenesis protein CcmH|nr:cytochrome c-type biogenesis protein CcmH [Anaerolineae bacterium]MBT7072587.1 cytochrome c-type biogenesis protein CcmH [Anaerolineae bacterium]MBT7324132.1 cytochrome c-type biogenesis protein CcmH [Anaerolineae bacterium]